MVKIVYMPDSSGRQKTATIGSYRIGPLQFIDVIGITISG